jgi:hypothetical protein
MRSAGCRAVHHKPRERVSDLQAETPNELTAVAKAARGDARNYLRQTLGPQCPYGIISVSNANTTMLFDNDNANRTLIINNDNANTATIVANDNANTATIVSNANANKNELRDLILRTQIEQDLSTADNSAVVAIFETPTANGGYLDLVTTIVTDTIAKVQAAGGGTGNAQQFLNTANTAKAAGDFKSAYASYRKAYKAAGK